MTKEFLDKLSLACAAKATKIPKNELSMQQSVYDGNDYIAIIVYKSDNILSGIYFIFQYIKNIDICFIRTFYSNNKNWEIEEFSNFYDFYHAIAE